MRKIKGSDAGQLYAMKVLKKATLKGKVLATSTSTFLVIFALLLSDGIQKFITIANVLEKKVQRICYLHSVRALKQSSGGSYQLTFFIFLVLLPELYWACIKLYQNGSISLLLK